MNFNLFKKKKEVTALLIKEKLCDDSKEELKKTLEDVGVNVVYIEMPMGQGIIVTRSEVTAKDLATAKDKFISIVLANMDCQAHA